MKTSYSVPAFTPQGGVPSPVVDGWDAPRTTDRPETFLARPRTAAVGVLERFPAGARPGIHALSFRVWRVDDDDRRPYVAIGYTAESRYERERGPDDDGEARWNHASWLLEDFERLGNVPEDPVGSQVYVEEARRPGAWYDGESDLDRVLDDEDVAARARLLRAHFRDAVIDLARHPRADGVIERVLGRPLPVVVFGMARPAGRCTPPRGRRPARARRGLHGVAVGGRGDPAVPPCGTGDVGGRPHRAGGPRRAAPARPGPDAGAGPDTGEGGGPGDRGVAAFGTGGGRDDQYQWLACQKDQASQALP